MGCKGIAPAAKNRNRNYNPMATMKNTPTTNQSKSNRVEAALDEALAESFPASDPIAISFPDAVSVVTETPVTPLPEEDSEKKPVEEDHGKRSLFERLFARV